MAVKISRILHAGYVFECENTSIAFDPIFENPFSRNCFAFPDVEFDCDAIRRLRFDAVFISHYHDDHCSLESLDFLDRAMPIYLFCIFDELSAMIRELGFTNVTALRLDQSVSIGAFEITARRALDADVDSIFQIRGGGVQILNVVDSWINDDTLDLLAQFAPWDMILWPFQTMRELEVLMPTRSQAEVQTLPHEWIDQLRVLRPRYVVPSSCQFIHEPWSWYNHALFPISYALFESELRSALPAIQVVRMNPSVSYSLEGGPGDGLKADAPLSWVKPVGDQNVDYEFKPDLIAPPVAEIARRFPALTSAETDLVHQYCRTRLTEKFRELTPPDDNDSSDHDYFHQPRVWRLRVYDHEGCASTFFYCVTSHDIAPIQNHDETTERATDLEPSEKIGWTTDIAAFKFYGALTNGESLTSMYIRVNDATFDSRTELEISTADVLHDPLIRCLFNGAFGSYQAAQLERLKRHAQGIQT